MRTSVLAAIGLGLLGSTAWAEGVTNNGCTLLARSSSLTCRLTNETGAMIDWIGVTIEVVEPGRDEAWAMNDEHLSFLSIEPGETKILTFHTGVIPEEAETRELEARFLRFQADGEHGTLFDATVMPTTDPSRPMEPPLPGETLYDFKRAVLACWDPGRLSPEAAETWVSLGIDLDRSGHITGEIRLENHRPDSQVAVQEAFDLARDAALACLADGYELPQEMYGQWQHVRVDFSPIPVIEP